jgi:LysR family glycine cleavage system transcriptional activator
MSNSIPPLNPLKVFETVARVSNLTKAAEELHVTQSAVSRQLGVLERYLGVRLFVREARGVSLTRQGREYQQRIGPAFAQIASATSDLRGLKKEKTLRVLAYTTFAAKWLLRHMHHFERAFPDIEVQITSAVEPVIFERDQVDIAIQFGEGKSYGGRSVLLFRDVIEPVCSPSLMHSDLPLLKPSDLTRHRLLSSRYRTSDWPDWLRNHGLGKLISSQSPPLPSSLLAYQAAIEGLGVVIGQPRLLEAEFSSNLLVRPFDSPLKRDMGYYAVLPPNRNLPQAIIFLEWLKSEVESIDYQ